MKKKGNCVNVSRKHRCVFALLLLAAVTYCTPAGRKNADEIPSAPFKSKCRILINEVSLEDIGNQFIELTKVCAEVPQSTRSISMNKYALVFTNEDDYILGSCLLQGEQAEKNLWFYTIGTESVQSNFKISDCNIISKLIHNGKARLPGNAEKRFTIMLVRNDDRRVLEKYSLISVGLATDKKKITPQVHRTLLTGLQDMYVVTDNKNVPLSQKFKSYYSRYQEKDQLQLQPAIIQTQSEMKSFGRCPPAGTSESHLPMKPTYFQLNKPSPGRPNECSPIESMWAASTNEPSGQPALPVPDSGSLAFNPVPTVSGIEMTSPLSIVLNQPSTERDQSFSNSEPEEEEETVFSYDVKGMSEFECEFGNNTSLFWNDCNNFPLDQLHAMQDLKFSPIDAQKVASIPYCTWAEFLIPPKKIRCKLCNSLLKQQIIFDRKSSPLLHNIMKNGAGQFKPTTTNSGYTAKSWNHDMLLEHDKSIMQQMCLDFKNHFSAGLRGKNLMDAFGGAGSIFRGFIQATSNLIISVLQSVKLGISFNRFTTMMETLDYFKAETGHLYRNPNGMKRIADLIGWKLHHDIVKRLIEEQPELSISLDTSTDKSGYGILAILFQTVEKNGDIKVYLYRVMHIPKGESGYDLFRQLKESLREDGLEEYVRSKVNALTTDGAPAVKNVFRSLLNGFANNEIVGVWCGAHKIERATEKAFAEYEFLKEIDKFLNACFRLLTTASPLRMEEFRSEIPKFGYRLFQIHRVREIRWLAHNVKALKPFIDRYDVIVATFEKIITNPKIPLEARLKAEELLNRLKDATFVGTLAFAADAMDILSEVSLDYQKHINTLIGKKLLRTQMENKLRSLTKTPGKYMQFVLENSELLKDNVNNAGTNQGSNGAQITMAIFELSNVKFMGVKLNNPNPMYDTHRVNTKINQYVGSIISQMGAYYPTDLQDSYDVFAPSLLSTTEDDIGDYGSLDLKKIKPRIQMGS